MSDPAKKLLDEALLLSLHDRAALAAELLASLDSDSEEDVEAAWAAEIERSVEKVSEGNGVFENGDRVREQLRPRT